METCATAKYSIRLVRDDDVTTLGAHVEGSFHAAAIGREMLAGTDRENVLVMATDARNNIIGVNHCHIGTLTASIMGIREIFKFLLLCNAARFICVHNHPSNDLTPSDDDKQMTEKLKLAGVLMDIDMLDHIIISTETAEFFSMAANAKGIS